MPNAKVKKWAKDAGVSVEKAELAWQQAVTSADIKLKAKQFTSKDAHYWAYVDVSTRKKLGLETKTREKEIKDKKAAKKKK